MAGAVAGTDCGSGAAVAAGESEPAAVSGEGSLTGAETHVYF